MWIHTISVLFFLPGNFSVQKPPLRLESHIMFLMQYWNSFDAVFEAKARGGFERKGKYNGSLPVGTTFSFGLEKLHLNDTKKLY